MSYTTIKKPSDYFNTNLYVGNGGTQSITGVGFQPDWVYFKQRTGTPSSSGSQVYDVVRSATKYLSTHADNVEATQSNGLTSFDSDGFSIGSTSRINGNTESYVAWNWKANGAGSANTDGSISSTVSANTTSGFSIVSYTGNGASNDTATIGHGLGVAPNYIIVKCLNAAGGWQTSSTSLGWNNVLRMEQTSASASGTYAFGQSGVTPTSTVFTVSATSGGNHTNTNSNNYIAYCFNDVQGYSKFGSYTGGGSNFPFIYTGFKPAFVMVKRTDSTSNWLLYDNRREGYNQTNDYLNPDNSNAEAGGNNYLDLLSNGFKTRVASQSINVSGASYIYMAFAEEPLVGDNPATAR